MLRNVLSRLPGLTSLPESCRPATAKALTRALSPQADTSVFNRSRRHRQNEGTRLTRSHSVPPPTKRYEHYHYGRFNENEDLQTKEYKYERKLADKEDLSENGSKQRKLTEVMSEMTYELEAAKPKRSKSCIDFDAFKQIEDQSFEQEMLDHLQPSMLKPFGSSQTYSPNTFRCRPQSYTKPVFRMNEALEGNVKSREDARDTISENHRRAFSTNSLPNEHEYGNKLMDTISESGSTAVSMKKGQRSYSQRSKPATKLNQKIESCISNLEQVAAEPAITSSPPEKEHIFDPIINNLLAAKKNNMTRYNPSLEDVSINPPPFLGSKPTEKPMLRMKNNGTRILDENRLTTPFPCFSEKLKYNVTTDAYVTPPAEILPKEKVMERHQMQSHKKGMENMQKRAISTSEGPLMMKSATVLAVQEKLRPSKMLDCPPEKTEKQPEESIKMAPDGRKCFLPSKVRLPVPECMPRPKHVCPPPPCKRADECLKILPKRLPFIPDGPCVCVEPYLPHVAPPMKRLDLSAEEPERVCPSPPCPQPRADDNMPHKPKQLKPYVPKPCACVEPPPMIDVPLKRLPPMCPPEEHERCFPERICPEEVCERADENLCVRPKKLPALVPKDCPSIEPEPMTDVRLKRLDLTMPEPPRICPCVEVCPCPRADDNYKPKHKPLRKIVPGDCPCIEPEYKDVHFKRLECIDEPEPCDVVDPCIPYPRADYGCWEYYTPPTPCEEIKKKRKSKKPVPRRMNFKPSTRCYSVQPRKNNFRDSADRLKSSTFTKLFKTNSVKAEEKVEKEQPLIPSMTNVVKKKAKPKTVVPNTVILLDQLNTLEKELSKDTIHFEPQKSNKIDIRKIMTSISAFEKESATKTAQRATVRNLSTTMATKLSSVPNTSEKVDIKVGQHGIKTTASTRKDDKCAKSNFCPKKERPCPKGPRLTPMKNCPSGERRPSCQRRRPINCCQKPPPPYPSFSELMDEEIEPFSEHAEWTCKRKECGFHPKTTKEFEPLNEKKHKKCYSTMTFNVKKLVDEQPDDLKSERGALGNDSSAKGPRSQRLDNGRFVRKLFQKETKERKSIAQCPSSISENCHVIRNTVSIPHEGNRNRLMKQKSNYGVVGLKNLPLDVTECHLVQSCPTTSIRRYSSNTNSFTRTYASESEKDKKTSVRICRIQHEKPRCQGKCPKFDYPHCPEKTDKRCDEPMKVCCKKQEAPYRAFSDCLTEEIQEELNECPLSREALARLQPIKKQAPIDDIALLQPRESDIGKIDLAKETRCIKKALCIDNQGLTQVCDNFGKPKKALKAREVLPDHYKCQDCLEVEREKREKQRKAAEPKSNCSNKGFGTVKRHYSTKAYGPEDNEGFEKEDLDDKENITMNQEKKALTLVISPRKMYMTAYNAFRKKASWQTEGSDCKNQNHIPSQPLPIYDDDPMQFARLRNAQWRINDSNKWKRLSHLQGTIKRNYSSYEYHGQLTHTQPLSTSVVSPHLEFLAGLNVSREVPALMMFAQAKMNKKLGAAKVVKRYSGSSGTSSKKDCRRKVEQQTTKSNTRSASIVCPPRIAEADIKRLQPQYPILPESDCSCDRQPCPFDNIIDRTMDLEYLRQKLGVKHEGLTQDCSNFGQRINKKQALQQLIKAGSSNSCCDKDSSRSRVDKCGASGDDDDCNKPKKSCDIIKTVEKDCEAREDRDQCVITKEERVLRKEEKRYIKTKEDPCEKKVDVCAQEETESCEVVQDPCEKEPVGKESWWQRLIDFFKARPGCPPPEEWKRKALREKAEKAAKAAGLIVCDPKDLPADIVCKCKSLPNVITPTVEKEDDCDKFEEKDPCQSSAKKMSSSHKRCGTTVTSITTKRCFSSKANSKALEEINKSLEEAEKRELAKKIVQSVNQMLTGSDVEEEGDENFESAEGAISDNVSTGNNKSNMFNSSQKMNQEPANLSYLTRIRSTPHFLDVMFHDKADDEFSGYQRARAFAAFQQYFSKIDTVTEINYDDIEKAKTKKILSELDKLLEDTKKKSNKNG